MMNFFLSFEKSFCFESNFLSFFQPGGGARHDVRVSRSVLTSRRSSGLGGTAAAAARASALPWVRRAALSSTGF